MAGLALRNVDENLVVTSSISILRIASFNVHCGKKLDRIIQDFSTPHLAACDIILLQEVEERFHFNQANVLAFSLGYYCAYMPARPTRRGTHGLAILSRYPLSDIERLDLPRNEFLINTRDRVALAATANVRDQQLRIYNVHLDTRISAKRRRDQLSPVVSSTYAHSTLPTIIAGDFNTFRLHHTSRLDEMLNNAGFTSPFVEGSHYTAKFLFWRPQLDWIYARKLNIISADVDLNISSSDHRPIWIDVALPE